VKDEVIAIAAALGLNPQGSAASVAAALTTLTTNVQRSDANAIHNGSAYPTRASVTPDSSRRVRWIGPIGSPPTIGGAYAISGFDIWEVTP
jgi:hypothetical protein